jgi:NAD(P)-dependent dehydrogenase (short-subunit alcohol dehydrogenase family)
MHAVIPSTIPRTALVTGAAQRLGRAIALALAESGFDLALHCRRSVAAAHALAAEIRGHGQSVAVFQADLCNEAEVAQLLASAAGTLGPIGVLVNNASTFARDEWYDVTRASWDAHLEPNLRAPFVLMQHFARALPASAEGVVINMLDQRVWSITPHFVSYTVSKVALWGLTQALALAFAPRIRVNAIGPGPALRNQWQTAAEFERLCNSVPLGRGTSPEEVGRAVLAILSLPAMTGQMLALDGGQHLQWKSGRLAPQVED